MRKKTIITIIASCLIPAAVLAQSMSSASYKVPFDDLSGGGVRSSSLNYIVNDTISESASPSGEGLASASYRACVGFQCLQGQQSLTVVIATSSSACTSTTSGTPPFTVGLGTLATGAVTTGANHICVRATTNASGGTVASIRGGGNGLASASAPADTIPAANGTLVAGTAGYGVCSAAVANGFTAQSPFNGTCDTGSGHVVGPPTATPQTVFSAPGAVTDAYGDILVKAAISTSTTAHADYADTLTIVVTGTY